MHDWYAIWWRCLCACVSLIMYLYCSTAFVKYCCTRDCGALCTAGCLFRKGQ